MFRRSACTLFMCGWCVSLAVPCAAAEFIGLGDLSGGLVSSQAFGVTFNGLGIVGSSISTRGTEAFGWTEATDIVSLGDLAGGDFFSEARAIGVAEAGPIIVGWSESTDGPEAFRWVEQSESITLSGLGDLDGGDFFSRANSISADGAVIVGVGTSFLGREAIRWTTSDGMVSLGDLPGGNHQSEATAISANGEIIVGQAASADGNEAFRFADDEMTGLGDLPGGAFFSRAAATSWNGSVVIGFSSSAGGIEAFRWTDDDGMVGLGDLPGGSFTSEATAVSGDGTLIVGQSSGTAGLDGFIWSDEGGMQTLRSFLIESCGLDDQLAGWRLTRPSAISDDGSTIVGWGSNPENQLEAWAVVLRTSLAGDTNDDGQVNIEDLNDVRNHFGGDDLGDTNGDGVVDIVDLNNVRNSFGQSNCDTPHALIPEPGSSAILAAGMVTISMLARRRRHAGRRSASGCFQVAATGREAGHCS